MEHTILDIYGTLGFTPKKFLPTLRSRHDVERAVVFHDDHADSQAAAKEVTAYCKSVGIALECVQLDAFDMVECASAMQKKVRARGAENILFNVTGGTTVLNAAAVLTCILEGVPAVYLNQESRSEIPLPLITARYDRLLSTPQRRVLAHINRTKGCTLGELVTGLGQSKPTMSHHVQKLVDYGLVSRRTDDKDARIKRLQAIPSARLLLDGDH